MLKLSTKLLLGFLACTVIGVFFSVQFYLFGVYMQRPIAWSSALHSSLVNWYIWGLLSLVVIALARRVPIEGNRWWARLAFHAACAVIIAVDHAALSSGWYWLIEAKDHTLSEWWTAFLYNLVVSFFWDVLTYAAIVGFVHAIDYYQKFRERELYAAQLREQLERARLSALRMQLNPHFLFNSLNAISELVHEDEMLADRAITRLAALLRMVLDESDKHEVTVREEIEFVRKYLEIEQIRLGDRLSVQIDVEPEVAELRIPSLILQPLIENAIRHGIGPQEAGGTVSIAARNREGRLELTVHDSGKGKHPTTQQANPGGLGLSNVRSRLLLHYSKDFEMQINEGLVDGYLVCIIIPIQTGRIHDRENSAEVPLK